MSTLNIVCPSCFTTNRVPEARVADGPTCGKCKTALFAGKPVSVNSEQFRKMVEKNDIPVVVDFWAEWCGPCKMFAPAFADAAASLEPHVRLVKVETDRCQDIASAYRIQSIPSLLIFRHGQEVARQAGAMPKGRFIDWVSANSAAAA